MDKTRKKRVKRPRNPYVSLLRRRGKAVEPSPKLYRRRPKHKKAVAEEGEGS